MAISPQEAIGNKIELEKEAIDTLDKNWEKALSKAYNGRGCVNLDIPKGVSDFVVSKVIERYEAKGWTVKMDGEQRDGYYYSFSPKGSR